MLTDDRQWTTSGRPHSKGCGVVEFEHAADAKRAITELAVPAHEHAEPHPQPAEHHSEQTKKLCTKPTPNVLYNPRTFTQ